MLVLIVHMLIMSACCHSWYQVCLPVRDLDLGYNLVKTHDGANAFLIVDHDEEDMISARAPIGNIYAPGELWLYVARSHTCKVIRTYDRRLHCNT